RPSCRPTSSLRNSIRPASPAWSCLMFAPLVRVPAGNRRGASLDPTELPRLVESEPPRTRHELRARYGGVPVDLKEAGDERGRVLTLAIRGEQKSPRHGHDNLVVDHLDDEANAFRHDRPPFGMTNSARAPHVPSRRKIIGAQFVDVGAFVSTW